MYLKIVYLIISFLKSYHFFPFYLKASEPSSNNFALCTLQNRHI